MRRLRAGWHLHQDQAKGRVVRITQVVTDLDLQRRVDTVGRDLVDTLRHSLHADRSQRRGPTGRLIFLDSEDECASIHRQCGDILGHLASTIA
jgi:hypothetical protein